jgi:hypothetical protein
MALFAPKAEPCGLLLEATYRLALLHHLRAPVDVVVVGRSDDDRTMYLLRAAYETPGAGKHVFAFEPGVVQAHLVIRRRRLCRRFANSPFVGVQCLNNADLNSDARHPFGWKLLNPNARNGFLKCTFPHAPHVLMVLMRSRQHLQRVPDRKPWTMRQRCRGFSLTFKSDFSILRCSDSTAWD